MTAIYLSLQQDPQVVTGSHDSTIKFRDLRYGKTMLTLTHHKKSVQAMALHPTEHCFVSASAENINKFNLPKEEFLHNMLSQQKTIINAMVVNEEGVLATGGDNGSLWFWDWKSGHNSRKPKQLCNLVHWIVKLVFMLSPMTGLVPVLLLAKLIRQPKCGKQIMLPPQKLIPSTLSLQKISDGSSVIHLLSCCFDWVMYHTVS